VCVCVCQFHSERRVQTEAILKQLTKENILTWEALRYEYRKLHDKEFHNLYRSPNIVRAVVSRGKRSVVFVARTGKRILHMYGRDHQDTYQQTLAYLIILQHVRTAQVM